MLHHQKSKVGKFSPGEIFCFINIVSLAYNYRETWWKGVFGHYNANIVMVHLKFQFEIENLSIVILAVCGMTPFSQKTTLVKNSSHVSSIPQFNSFNFFSPPF